MSTNYEPTAEQVERMKRELAEIRLREFPTGRLYDTVARFILQRQHSREKGLLQTLRSIKYLSVEGSDIHTAASDAIAAHAALDAPPEPTLLEAAKAFVANEGRTLASATDALAALKAAVEREERAK